MNRTQELLTTLRNNYGHIQSIDPEGGTYEKLCDFLDGLSDDHITILKDARIKWVSSLARNRYYRRNLHNQ